MSYVFEALFSSHNRCTFIDWKYCWALTLLYVAASVNEKFSGTYCLIYSAPSDTQEQVDQPVIVPMVALLLHCPRPPVG